MPRAAINDLNALLELPHHILFEAVSGSRAYGTAHAESDEDIRGIYALPQSSYLSLVQPPPHVNVAFSIWRQAQTPRSWKSCTAHKTASNGKATVWNPSWSPAGIS